MPPKRLPMFIALAVMAIVLIAIAYFAWLGHQQTDLKSSLAAGYATQPLASPFTLTSKSWAANSKSWQYNYTASEPSPDAITAAKSQLAKGAYQVDTRRPDAVSGNSATLYRDLITEDVALTIKITPSTAQTSLVTVTLSAMPE